MDRERLPKPGQIYNHFKDKPYQIITIATHAETKEKMVVYQALYGEFKTYIRPLENFLSEVDHVKYPEVTQKYRFECIGTREPDLEPEKEKHSEQKEIQAKQVVSGQNNIQDQQNVIGKEEAEAEHISRVQEQQTSVGGVNNVLLQFLDAESYYKKLEVITSNRKHMTDRLINDIAVSLDCAVDEGPIDQRIQNLIICLQALCRFEDRRQR